MFCFESPTVGSSPANWWAAHSLASSLTVSFPLTPECLRTQMSLTECWVEISFSALWHCYTIHYILTAWRTFKAAWLSAQILIYFSDWPVFWIPRTQAQIAYVLAWKTVVYLCPKTPAPVLSYVLGPSVSQTYFNYRSRLVSLGPYTHLRLA